MTDSDIGAIAEKVRVIMLDVDGVLTDGSIILDNDGNEYKSFHVRDGHAIKVATQAGMMLALITGRRSRVVDRRAEELGIQEIHQGVRDKMVVYRHLREKYGFSDDEVSYMGDDVVDLSLLRVVGLPAVPSDADPEALKVARFVARNRGGRGAVRELVEVILRAKGQWDALVGLTKGA